MRSHSGSLLIFKTSCLQKKILFHIQNHARPSSQLSGTSSFQEIVKNYSLEFRSLF